VELSAYDPPGFMTDFDRIPGQRAQWSLAVSGWFDECVAEQLAKLQGQPCQFYNQLRAPPNGTPLAQDIVWNGFSGTLRNRYGRAQALKLADTPVPLTQRIDGPGSYFVGGQWESLFYRPLDEYCEWHVTRDPDGKIRRVTFTSEPPEYWQALHGDTLPSIAAAISSVPRSTPSGRCWPAEGAIAGCDDLVAVLRSRSLRCSFVSSHSTERI
jgi:hypothetical protein